mgnify:CR=1 FL=1
MKIVLVGGGTGGHIYPALAIARGIQERVPDIEILYVGTARGMESRIVPEAGLAFATIDAGGLNRHSLFKAMGSLARVPRGFWQARTLLKEFRPDLVVGTGGYVSYPVVMAASIQGIKTVIHEQNAYPGLANRAVAGRVEHVLLTFAEAQEYLKARRVSVTGLPVRSEILAARRNEGLRQLGFSEGIFTLVAFGGSRGAMSINQAMLRVIERYLMEKIQILWITGETGYNEMIRELPRPTGGRGVLTLKVLPYMSNIEDALAAASLVVCRAGAATLAELAVLGVPAILVPYPYAAENHQEKNALSLKAKGAAQVIIDEFLDGDVLFDRVEKLRNDPSRLRRMAESMQKEGKPEALQEIVDIIMSYLG